jgi:predicted GH43/DUF377 family glycosyl hydrolase
MRIRSVLAVVLLVVLSAGQVSADSGPVGWTKYPGNPVLGVGAPGAWDDAEVFDPAILYEGGLYRMWYTGDRGGNLRLIGYATSADGQAWTRYGGNPVLAAGAPGSWDADGARWATVISDGGVFKMWYTGRDASGTNRIGYATSPDGIAWTKYAGNPVLDLGSAGAWDERRVSEPAVIKDGATYKMCYGGRNIAGWDSIGYATSPDGLNWTRYARNPVLVGSPPGSWDIVVYAPSVILEGGVYAMAYSGCNNAGTACEIGYARSADGIHWTRQGRVIQQGSDGSFDRYSADYPALLRIEGTAGMGYSGYDGSNYRIGYASAPWLDLLRQTHMPLALRNSGACNPLRSDDFTDYRSGWPIEDAADAKFDYMGGEYQILAKMADSYWVASPGVQMSDGVIVASVRFGATGDDSDHGDIVFGQSAVEAENFYRFMIRRDGDYCVQRHDAADGWHQLKCDEAMGYLPYPATNRLKVVRSGATITAYLNGQWLASVSDGSYMGSLQVGLSAGTDAGNADLRFDAYGVYPVSCADQVSQ